MTRRAITTTSAADADIRDIASYLALDNPQIALKFEREFSDALIRTSDAPNIGHMVQGSPGDFLVVRVSQRFRRYLVFYRYLDEKTIEVVRVIHGARDVSLAFAKAK